jgi:perosamine synthetase
VLKLFDPNVTEQEFFAVREVLRSHNWASGAGLDKVKKFEMEFCKYLGANSVVTVSSGTAALHLALSLISPKDMDVLIPSLSFVSTAHAVMLNGAKPVFVDVEPATLCIDSKDVEKKVRPGHTKAILPVHFGGMPCDMRELKKIAKSNDLIIIEDAAHACGSKSEGKSIGSISEMTCFSFHPVKNLSMPNGGAIALNSSAFEEYVTRLHSLRWCGIDCREGTSYDVTSISPNYYLNEISAAIGLVQLGKLDVLNKRRREIASRYFKEIDVDHKMPYSDDCVYHLYWILCRKRKELIKYLNDKGIEVGTHYRPINTFAAYKENFGADIPVTERVGTEIITIPIHTNLSDADVNYIISSINKFL